VKNDEPLFGLLAEFGTAKGLLEAAERAHAVGYRRMDAFAPFPIEGLPAAIGRPRNRVALCCLLGGIIGGSGGYFMQDYAMSSSYMLNIGGRPLHNIPPYIPITFELTILCAALCTVVGMLVLNGLPRFHHPVFGVRGFDRATTDRFFLCIEARDVLFERGRTDAFLAQLEPLRVAEVPA
jgi:Protein of unknown function (DUF3341)